jgi:hypothetical protein
MEEYERITGSVGIHIGGGSSSSCSSSNVTQEVSSTQHGTTACPTALPTGTRQQQYHRGHRLVHQLPAPVPIRKVLQHFIKKKLKECHTIANNHTDDSTNSSGMTKWILYKLLDVMYPPMLFIILYR